MEYLTKDFIVYGKNGDSRRNMGGVKKLLEEEQAFRELEILCDSWDCLRNEKMREERKPRDTIAEIEESEKMDELKKQRNLEILANTKKELSKLEEELYQTCELGKKELGKKEENEEEKHELSCKIRGIRIRISHKKFIKITTELSLKNNSIETNFKNLYRARKKEIESLKNYISVCEAKIDGTKREIRMTKAKESLNDHDEEHLSRMENWLKRGEEAHFKLLEYIEKKEREISWFEPFAKI